MMLMYSLIMYAEYTEIGVHCIMYYLRTRWLDNKDLSLSVLLPTGFFFFFFFFFFETDVKKVATNLQWPQCNYLLKIAKI